jgi:hypothetical protein
LQLKPDPLGRREQSVNWDALGAGAELLGAIATVATLVYLAVQIRQNTKMGQIATATSRSEQRFQQSAFISQSSETNRLFWTGLYNPESLNVDEYRYFESIFSTYLLSSEAAFGLRKENVLSESEWKGNVANISWLLSLPGFQRYWSSWRDQYPPDYSAFIESIMSDPEFSSTSSPPSNSGRTSPAAQQSAAADSAQV